MKTKAVRLYGEQDLRLEEFELPALQEDGVLVKIISDSICMSSYKAAMQGKNHKRVPNDAQTNPIIIGHEFCGEIVEVKGKWREKFSPGDRFAIQPAHYYNGSLDAPGYSYTYCGGDATYAIIPMETLEMDCLLRYDSDVYFYGSLAEPMSCIVGTYHAMYHTEPGSYEHKMGIVEGGKMALLASVGPMGLGAIDYALHAQRRPSLLVVTDIDDARLERAKSIFTVEHAKEQGVELIYLNTAKAEDPVKTLMELTGNTGYDDVMVFAPVAAVVEQGDAILGHDGCLNFFAGPSNTAFSAKMNFYNVHYGYHHVVGTSGGNTDDMKESIQLMGEGKLNPAVMVTHIGGLDCVAETTLNLPNIPGGKKLIYNHISMPLTAIADFEEKGKTDPLFKALDEIVKKNNGLWCAQAEKYLLDNAKPLALS
ncbi:zinc-binding dehydrogenase [Christensenellaceae bacterium OttesenSCG-928-M15]|nr:zinc-binding dehydrogenase [Christensenellaceae bacterium OttesenSCG-928-M15]